MNRREAIAALTALPAIKSISHADLKPTDVIVVECEGRLSQIGEERIREQLLKIWPKHQIVICQGDIRLRTMAGAKQ